MRSVIPGATMKPVNRLIDLLWNKDEKRLRAFLRLGIHTLMVLLATGFFTAVLMSLAALISMPSGASFKEQLTAGGLIQWTERPAFNLVIAPLSAFFGIGLATYLAGLWIDRRPLRKFGINFKKGWWADFLFGLGLGAVLMGIIFLIGWLTGSVRVSGFFEVNAQNNFFLGMIQSLIFFVLVGIYEELLSRGYHLINLAEGLHHPRLGARLALLLAYGLSSLVFGMMHLSNPNATWVSTVNVSLAGLFLGLGMILTGSMAIPIGLHVTWNFFQGSVFGFAVSGFRTGVSVIGTEIIANTWLIGGDFGPESGLLSLAAMLLGSALTILWVRRNGQLKLYSDLAVYEPRVKKQRGKMLINDFQNQP